MNGFYATDLEKKIKEGIAIQIPGLGDKEGKIPLEPEDLIKIIIKLKEKKIT